MESEPLYDITGKYRWVKSYDQCIGLDTKLLRTFHTCPKLLEIKRNLEHIVRHYRGNVKLTNHFKTPYQKRKVNFYRVILHDLLNEEIDTEKQIGEFVKDILFIYSKKKEELEIINDLSNHYEAEEAHREEMRESIIAEWRCDYND